MTLQRPSSDLAALTACEALELFRQRSLTRRVA